jgi:uncharacterized protein
MPRPCKFRTIGLRPGCTYFKPRAIPMTELETVELKLDQLEAVKLADFDGLYHTEAADRMNISRQTFDRILIEAHKTIADALINGKAILINGGNIKLCDHGTFKCNKTERR